MAERITKIISAGVLGIFICPVFINTSSDSRLSAMALEREAILRKDVETYAKRAAGEKTISIAEKERILRFVQDSLPENTKRLKKEQQAASGVREIL